jgi:hypothetical protein
VDEQLSLDICIAQLDVFRRLAEHLHNQGFYVYLREGMESQPLRFIESRLLP